MTVKSVSTNILEKWLIAWSLSRELPLPVKFKSGFEINVGYDEQKKRYVFAELNEDFINLSNKINEPWMFLKVCSPPDKVKACISSRWTIQPQGFAMSCFHRMDFKKMGLCTNYKVEYENYNSTFVIKIITNGGELASIGRVVLIDDLAVYDRILTTSAHRRKKLATYLMYELENIAISRGIFKNFLVATEEGKSLYLSLGWKVESLYTSIVISG